MAEKPILITGSHRSGTTWVGRMVASAPKVVYVHEPFNVNSNNGICSAKFPYWYTYVCAENESEYYGSLCKTVGLRYDLLAGLREARSVSAARRKLKEFVAFTEHRRQCRRPLIKDPIALFSAEWLAERFDMSVIVLIRHPAAFAASLKAKSWHFPFQHFLDQKLLMRDHLYSFEQDIRRMTQRESDIIEQAALLWKIIHHVIGKFRDQHPDWTFVRHEDLSRDPLGRFESMFAELGVEFTGREADVIRQHSKLSSVERDGHDDNRRSDLERNSLSNINAWKKKLTQREVDIVHKMTAQTARAFYASDEW